MVGGSLRGLRLLPPLKLHGSHDIAEILQKVEVKHQKSNQPKGLWHKNEGPDLFWDPITSRFQTVINICSGRVELSLGVALYFLHSNILQSQI